MKYNIESLEKALDYLLPNIKRAKDKGANFNNTDCCSMVAKDFFIKSLNSDYNPSFDERMAIFVVQEALKDLEELGHFSFGDLTIDLNN